MPTKTVIHIIGAASSKGYCLEELKKEVGGVPLVFSFDTVLKSKNGDADSECLRWIRKQVDDEQLILTSGLSVSSAKRWIRKAFPKDKFKNLIWEVHHDKGCEKLIVNERSWSLLIDGILSKGKKAIELGFSKDHELIKGTPLRIAMEYIRSGKEDVSQLCKKISEQQELENSIRLDNAVVCREAFSPIKRNKCIHEISKMIRQNHQKGKAV